MIEPEARCKRHRRIHQRWKPTKALIRRVSADRHALKLSGTSDVETRTMRSRTTLTATMPLLLTALTACGSNDKAADAPARKKAMVEQYRDTVAKGDDTPESRRPKACADVDDATLTRIKGEAIKEYLESDDAEKAIDEAVKDGLDDVPFTEVTPNDTGLGAR